mgnify:CR=1 FL=1
MYKLIIKLAFNNAFLKLSRTLLIIIMIAVSMGMMLSIQGIYDGMTLNMIDNTKRSDSGDVSIYNKEYRLNKLLKNSIKDSRVIVEELKKRSEIDAIVVRMKTEGLSSTARKSAFSSIIGINLKDEEKFGRFSEFLKKGKLNLEKRNALIGSELAKTLKIKIGSKVIFSTQDSLGEIIAISVKISGIVQTSNMSLDTTALYVDRNKLNNFLEINSKTNTQIAIMSKDKLLISELKKTYSTFDVKSFLELYPMLKQMKDVMVIFNSITFFIVMFVVFIGILGVMYVSILDRVREFGILRSIGMPYKYIRIQVVLESLIIGFIGYVFGSIIGICALQYLQTIGLDLSSFADGMESFGYETTIHADIKLSYFTSTFMAIMSASIISVFLPLRKIKTCNPIEVIKADS